MNLNNNILDDISDDQAIFTNTLIYRKIKNLTNDYDIYVLTRLNNQFVWSKTKDRPGDNTLENFNDLRCVNTGGKYLTIYRLYEGMVINMMIYNSENMIVWNYLDNPIDINEFKTISLLDIPSHIDLTLEENSKEEILEDKEILKEPRSEYDEGIPFDINFEPLCGWENLLNREPPDEMFINDDDTNIQYDNNENEKNVYFDKNLTLEIPAIEYRLDPYDNEYYTKAEFLDYYGGLIEWENQDPKLVLKREQYYHFSEMFNHLSDKRFKYLLEKYENTFI